MKKKLKLFRGEEEKLRIKNLTGGYVVVTTDGQVRFDLYAAEKKTAGRRRPAKS